MLEFIRTPGPVRSLLLVSLQSSVGNAIGYVALVLVAYDRFRSPWAVSLVLLADFLPAIALGPVFGALADRRSRRTLAVSADLLRAAAFVGLAAAGSFAAILALALVAGTGTALYHPATKSALAGLAAPRGDEAMGALVTIWSAASVAGPALAAGLLLALSPAGLLLVNATTFLVSAAVLSRLPLDREEAEPRAAAAPDDLNVAIVTGEPVASAESEAALGRGVRAGLRAARQVDGLSTVVGAGVAATLAFSLMNVAEPLLATDELDAGDAGFALLVCLYGVGSTVGTLHGRADLRFLVEGLAGGGLLLFASALAPSVTVAAVTFLGTGLFAGAVMSSDHQLVARLAPAPIRGRVFGLKDSLDAIAFSTAFVAGGLIASLGDSRVVFAVAGASTLLVAALGALGLRHTRVGSATEGQRRGRQTGRRARGARRPAGY
ncbi:MAG TPA: MFS transporter [Solirubrobacteraceae bacterium]|nr:MFS transporter [Solirubrobacteraceae bacterium]